MKELWNQENKLHLGENTASSASTSPIPLEGQVYITGDRFYKHNLMRLNYMTYDVRRAQDIINPSTSNCNIMLLADQISSDPAIVSPHPYIYARVLGIFHINATYTGPDVADYYSHRVNFLWVRWYQYVEDGAGWDASTLDCVRFLPMADDGAFGFVDPDDVLRGCHIIPQFSHGLRHLDGTDNSHCAQDSLDWHFYYVNRFVFYLSDDILTMLIFI